MLFIKALLIYLVLMEVSSQVGPFLVFLSVQWVGLEENRIIHGNRKQIETYGNEESNNHFMGNDIHIDNVASWTV